MCLLAFVPLPARVNFHSQNENCERQPIWHQSDDVVESVLHDQLLQFFVTDQLHFQSADLAFADVGDGDGDGVSDVAGDNAGFS